jgi:hypothetical protein
MKMPQIPKQTTMTTVKLFREYLASKNIKPFQNIDDLIVMVEEE